MRIAIDARLYGPSKNRGLGRYVEQLVKNLQFIEGEQTFARLQENEYIVLLRRENFDEYEPRTSRFRKVLTDYPWYSFAEQIFLPWKLWRLNCDLVHFPHFNVPIFCPKKFVVTIHDLIMYKFPNERATTRNKFFYKIKYWLHKLVVKSAVRRAERVITDSEFTKRDIVREFKVDEEKVKVIYLGFEMDQEIKKSRNQEIKEVNKTNVSEKFGIRKPYLLYVGSAYPHKNLEILIKAFKEVREKHRDLQLVLVGKEDYFYKKLKQFSKGLCQNSFNILGRKEGITDFIFDYIYRITEKVAKNFYFDVLTKLDPYVPSLETKIEISHIGWEHTFESIRRQRKSEKFFRFFALPKIVSLLLDKKIKPTYEIGRDPKDKVEFWSFLGLVEGVLIKVVLRSINEGPKHLFSVVWKGEIFENKKELSGACIPRVQGVVTLQLLYKEYSMFIKNLSRLNGDKLSNKEQRNDKVVFTGRVSNGELAKLYQNAVAYVFPSLCEGFGLPGLEAMSYGVPVVAARASCLPEIYGEAALYFSPHNEKDLAEKVSQIMSDGGLRGELVSRGYEQIKKYSWRECARETLWTYTHLPS